MADFSQALKILLRHEGGFVNDPADRGGATNYGLTAKTLASYLKQPVSVDQMKSISLNQVSHIYKTAFWNEMNLDQIKDQTMATILFDLGVLLGVPTMVRLLEDILDLYPDGILGSHTIAAINQYLNPAWLSVKILEECQLHFIDQCQRDSTQIKFLAGWVRRTHDLFNLVIESKT